MITIQSLRSIDGEPRVLDTDLGAALGLAMPTNIRATIAANRGELEMHGSIYTRRVEMRGPGRPGTAYYLNEGQTLVICALSRTPAGVAVRKILIDLFMAYRQGKVVHVREHHRRPPVRLVEYPGPSLDRLGHYDSFFRAFADQPEALAEWALNMETATVAALRAFSGRPSIR